MPPAVLTEPLSSPATDPLRSDLARLFGHADFRTGQREVVEAALAGRDTLAVLPTGGGKSLTYQLPAMLVEGATLVLSPLIALMRDQTENLPPEVAARSTVINSSLDGSEVGRRLALVKSGRIKMIYAAPERLRQPTFLHALREANVSLVVVDEAHCISQWGHDFRPDYRAVGRAVSALNPRSVLAVTATATPDVQDDIERQLGRKMTRLVRSTYRDNLYLACRKVSGEDEKLYATLDLCRENDGVGLVYAGSRDKCEQLSRMMKRYGVEAGFYHAGLPPNERAEAQDRFMRGDVRVMAATVAFGMGVDKADIRFLVHYHPSRTLENYYQEAGRAGRDGLPSVCTLLYSSSDAAGTTRRLREDTLTLDDIKSVYQAVRGLAGRDRIGPVAFGDLVQTSGGDENLVRAALPLLEEAGMIARYADVPRALNLYPENDFAEWREQEPDPAWPAFAPLVARQSDWNPVELSHETGVALPELEGTILRLQEAGHLTYRAAPRELLLQILPAPSDAKQRMAETLAHRASGAQSRADAMLAYARDRKCRHGQIARYFGDRWPHLNCGQCDVCAPRAATGTSAVTGVSSTLEASASAVEVAEAPLYVLRAVADLTSGRSTFALGKSGLVRLLRGTPDAPVKPDRTPAFGTLATFKKAEIERLIDALTEQNLLRRDDDDEYRRLYLTAEGRDCVRTGEADVEWRKSPAPSVSAASSGDALAADVDEALLAKLKDWRRETAQNDAVPPYVVFPDKTLIALAIQKPANEIDLGDISGIGPAKQAKYGETVLELIRRHTRI